jgi:hypothetical protein
MADLYPNDMLIEVDFVLTPSTCLRETLINSGIDARRVFCLPDAVETVPCLRKKYFPRSSDMHATTKIVWVGNEGHWPTLDTIRALLDSHPSFKTYKLVTISNHPDADIAWQLDRVWDDIISCDIGVVPVDVTNPRSLVKSNNRATMYMALALPVVCTPISSYAEFIRHGVNGFLATSDSDWVELLYALRDPALRQRIGETAFAFAHAEFSRDMIASKLVSILNELRPQRTSNEKSLRQ